MTRRHPVVPGVEYKRLALEPLIGLNFPNEDHVVATVVLFDVATNKVGDDSIKQGYPGDSFDKVNTAESVQQRG